MDNKALNLILTIGIAVLIAFGIVSHKEKGMLLRDIAAKQDQMLSGGGASAGVAADIAKLEVKLEALETKLSALTTKVNSAPAAQAKGSPRQAPPGPDPNIVHDIPIGDSYVMGNKNAKNTIVEFVDFECPFCARFHPPVEEALKAYPKDVKVIIKNFPLSFHQNAKPAAKAALAAGEQGKYQEMALKLLENGRNLNSETYKKLADEIGLDVKKFEKALIDNDAKYEKQIQTDMALGAKVGVRGTPSFYFNGKTTSSRSFDQFKAQIEANK